MKLLKTCSFLVLTTVVWLPSLSADAAGDGIFEVLVDDVYVTGNVLVDDFNGTTIDFSKWSWPPNEYAVKLDTVNDNLVMISAGNSVPIPFNVTQTNVKAPNLASIQATITVVDTVSEILYGVDRVGDNLITIDTATGAGTAVGALGFNWVDSLAFDPATGILYGVDSDSDQLITIDPATGAGTAVGPVGAPNVEGLAFGNGGILYAVDLSLNVLLTINTSTGAATIVGPLGFNGVSSLAYDTLSGILYGVDYLQDQLITINTATGAGAAVGTAPGTAGPGNVAGLAFAANGTLYAVEPISEQLLTIDTVTGTAAVVGPVGFNGQALAFSANRSSANIAGQYYNANSATPASQDGDIMAIVSIGDRNGDGDLEAWATILESIDPFFGTWNTSTYDIIIAPGALLPNMPYVARIEYNGLNQFTFTVDGTSIVQPGPVRLGPAYQTRQHLSVTSESDPNASIMATFDDLNLGNVLIDDFSTDLLDRSIWADYSHAVTLSSRVYPAVTGKLLLFASNQDIPKNGRADAFIRLEEFNPDRIEALVSISSSSMLQPGIRGRIRLNGYAYNEKRDGGVVALPYNGCEDAVWVQVQINLKDGALWATADAGPETVDCDTKTILISETFVKPLAFDTEYLLWIERVGNTLTLGLDNESYSHTILTPIYPPSPQTGYRRLNARIQDASTPDDGGDGDDDGGGGGGGGGGSLSPWLLLSLILGIWMLRTRISSRYKK